jgi:pimeloyl-ACP methyl ester carboxylesterase
MNAVFFNSPYLNAYFEDISLSPPPGKVLLETVEKITCFALSILSDLVMTFFAAGLLLIAFCYKSNFDPSAEEVKKDRTPILMIHGNGFNEIQWVVGRQFLSGDQYGSVFTLNLDGLISNKTGLGIDDYAQKVNNKITEIKTLTGRNDITLIGHSMGGLVASYCAENLIDEKTQINQIITISSPWHGSPLLQYVTKITENFFPSLFKEPKRYRQMNNEDYFLDHLKKQVFKSEKEGKRNYYSIYSEADLAVLGESGRLHNKAKHINNRSKSYPFLGHFTPMVYFPLWKQIQIWVNS